MLDQLIHRYFPTNPRGSGGAPPSSTSPQLPLEVIFKIIDEHFTQTCISDVKHLCRLSLVCRALAWYCRPILFRSICVACCSSCIDQRRPSVRERSGWRRPTLFINPSDFSTFLQQDSPSSLGSIVAGIEELHLVLPSILMSDLMRSFGLDNIHKSSWPWLWILHMQKEQLKGLKRLKVLLGTTPVPGFLQAALMRVVDEAPSLEMLDVYGTGVASAGKFLLSSSSPQVMCASVKLLELDMSVWEYIYRDVILQHETTFLGPPTFPNLRGLALRGVTRALFQAPSIDLDSTPGSRSIIGGHSSPGITHIHFQRLYGRLENEHIFILGLSGRTLRCLHLELAILREAVGTIGVPHQAIPLDSLVALEYIEVEMMGVGHVHDSLGWISRSIATTNPSSPSSVLNRLRTHIIVNDPMQHDARQTIDEQRQGIEQKYFAIWRSICSVNRWPNLEQADVYALVRVLIEGDVGGRARAPRLLGRYRRAGDVGLEDGELARGLGPFCSCSDLLSWTE
ncbi:hypothetical protein BKA70DRAFT_58018 [Coprinopsis sp. MPI-PUGE-AT-0042]|nr:hypothetical protein BKA70DRAFT_58018 [Coprinopsis sp. MPI-PUGE-AT-0042]